MSQQDRFAAVELEKAGVDRKQIAPAWIHASLNQTIFPAFRFYSENRSKSLETSHFRIPGNALRKYA